MIKADKQKSVIQLSLDLPLTIDQNYLKEALSAILYYNGVLSEKQARMLIGKTR